MSLLKIADDLQELRRYVRSHPEYVREQLTSRGHLLRASYRGEIARIADNLRVGLDFIRVDPEVLEAYLYAAVFEIRKMARAESCAHQRSPADADER